MRCTKLGAIAFLGAFIGCGPDYSKPVRTIAPSEPDAQQRLTAMPKEFPADFPMYPDSAFVDGSVEGQTIRATFETKDTVDKAIKYFLSAPLSDGWKVEQMGGAQGTFGLRARKDKTELSISVGPGGGRALINFVYTHAEGDAKGSSTKKE